MSSSAHPADRSALTSAGHASMERTRAQTPVGSHPRREDTVRILVAYRSRYGHTRSYAEWLAADLDADLVDLGERSSATLAGAAVAILVTPIYAGRLLGAKRFAALAGQAPGVPLVGVSVSASDPADPTNTSAYRAAFEAVFPAALQARMRWFHLRGGIDYPRLSLVHRVMMWLAVRAARRAAADGDAEAQAMVATYGTEVDFRDRTTIRPIVDHVRDLTGGRG